MSTLAFDKHGKPFTFARNTRKLLVRFFRNPGGRGTCVAVLDGVGERVYVDADADYHELRRAVGNEPGLYRLDQCDVDGNEIDDVPAAYVSIASQRNAAGAADEVNPLAIVRELASINAEVTKTLVDRFAAVMERTAGILDSAAGAGILDRRLAALAALEARVPAVKDDEDDQEGEEDGDEAAEAPQAPHDPWAPFAPILKMVQPMLPQLGVLLYGKIQELVSKSTRTAPATAPSAPPAPAPSAPPAPAASAPPAPASSAPPAPAPSAPPASAPSAPPAPASAPVAVSTSAPAPASAPAATPSARIEAVGGTAESSATMQPQSVSQPPAAATAMESISVSSPAPTASAPPATATAMKPSSASSPAPTTSMSPATVTAMESPVLSPGAPAPTAAPALAPDPVPGFTDAPAEHHRNAPLVPTSEQLAHLQAIRERLSPREAAITDNAVTRMSTDMLARWLAELSAFSVDDAVQTIRSMIASTSIHAAIPDSQATAIPIAPDARSHLTEISKRLTSPERRILRQVLRSRHADALIRELVVRSVEDAVALVKATIARIHAERAADARLDEPSGGTTAASSPDFMALVTAVAALLTADERAELLALLPRLPAEQVEQLKAQLLPLPPDVAASWIRGNLTRPRAEVAA